MDNYIGTAYDTVKLVADNLATINTVADNIDSLNTYLGSSPTDPTVRTNGDPLQNGDMYFNTTVFVLKTYQDGEWITVTSTGTTVVDNFVGDGVTTDFGLSTLPGTEETTEVYINGVYQHKNSYSISGAVIVFSEAPEVDHEIEVLTTTLLSIIKGTATESQLLTSGQTLVSFTNNIVASAIHVSGIDIDSRRLMEGLDYTKDILNNQITLLTSFPAGTSIFLLYEDATDNTASLIQSFFNRQSYVGDGSTTVFLSQLTFVDGAVNTIVTIDGVTQNINAYSTSNNYLTFSEAPPLNSLIEIIQIAASAMPVATAAQTGNYTLTAGQTVVNLASSVDRSAFFISGPDVDSGRLIVNVDYTLNVATKTLTLTESYPAGTLLVQVFYDSSSNVFDNGSVVWTSGLGSPEGVVTANVGSMYTRTDGGVGTTLYVKETGTGNTGWAAK